MGVGMKLSCPAPGNSHSLSGSTDRVGLAGHQSHPFPGFVPKSQKIDGERPSPSQAFPPHPHPFPDFVHKLSQIPGIRRKGPSQASPTSSSPSRSLPATEPQPRVLGPSHPHTAQGSFGSTSSADPGSGSRSRLWIPIPSGSQGIQAGAVSLQTPPRTKGNNTT